MGTEAERRMTRRYPLAHEVHYSVRNTRTGVVGTGTTVNMSSHGVLFTVDQPLQAGITLTLEVQWPVLLDNAKALKLVTHGKVVWCDCAQAAVEFHEWEFHTRRGPQPTETADPKARLRTRVAG
jgi:hypothetical protein